MKKLMHLLNIVWRTILFILLPFFVFYISVTCFGVVYGSLLACAVYLSIIIGIWLLICLFEYTIRGYSHAWHDVVNP